MGKVNPAEFGRQRPKLTRDDFSGDFTVLTIATAEEVKTDDGKSMVLTFQETGDKSLWLNVTALKTLVEKFGDNADAWKGKQVPVEKHTAEFRGEKYPKVRVALGEDWDDMFKQAKKGRAGAGSRR